MIPALQILVDDAADIDAFKDYQPSGGSSEAGSAQEASQEETSSPPEGAVLSYACCCCCSWYQPHGHSSSAVWVYNGAI